MKRTIAVTWSVLFVLLLFMPRAIALSLTGITSKKGFEVSAAVCFERAGAVRAVQWPSTTDPSLVARYGFDHSLPADLSGRGHHLGPGAVTIGPGFESRGSLAAFTAPGATPDAVAKAHADFTTPAFSVSLWVFLHEDTNNTWRTLLSKGNTSDDLTPSILVRPGERKLHVAVRTQSEWQEAVDTQGDLPLKRWTHVAVTVDSVLRVYINGLKQAEVILQGALRHNDGDVFIGKDPWRQGANAYIDDVRWHNVVLSDAQILAMLAKHAPLPISIGCTDCSVSQAMMACASRRTRLCTPMELYSGGYAAARGLGFPQEAWTVEGPGMKTGICCH